MQTQSSTKYKLLVIVLIAILSVGGVLTWVLLKDRSTQTAATNVPAPVRSFSYWLDLTRIARGKTADKTIRASGQEVFTSGDRFTVNVSSPQPGYLYLINEGRNYQDITTFYYIGKFTIKPDTVTSSSQLAFDNKDGTEQFWFLFSKTPLEMFEKYQSPREIPQGETQQVQAFLTQSVPADLSSSEDMSNAQTMVRGSGEIVAYKVSLRHRR